MLCPYESRSPVSLYLLFICIFLGHNRDAINIELMTRKRLINTQSMHDKQFISHHPLQINVNHPALSKIPSSQGVEPNREEFEHQSQTPRTSIGIVPLTRSLTSDQELPSLNLSIPWLPLRCDNDTKFIRMLH